MARLLARQESQGTPLGMGLKSLKTGLPGSIQEGADRFRILRAVSIFGNQATSYARLTETWFKCSY